MTVPMYSTPDSNEATPEVAPPQPRQKRPYAKPELSELGSVRDLTLNASGTKGDGGFGRQVG